MRTDGHTDRWTDGHDGANTRFFEILQTRLNKKQKRHDDCEVFEVIKFKLSK
jgi:hypothetical protein